MRRPIAWIVITLCMVSFSGSAAGARYFGALDGNRLLSMCDESASFCVGYIFGVMDAFGMGRASGQWATEVDYCAPEQPSGRQVEDIVTAYLEGIPKTRHQHAATLVVYALADAWPCP